MISIARPPHNILSASAWRFAGRSYDLSRKPLLAAILNLTPDSFSDGGLYSDPGRAEVRALELESQGADFIDIGAESTRPGAEAVSEEGELQRLLPALKRIVKAVRVPVSVDTYKPEVMRQALALGASIVNDVSALEGSPEAARIVAEAGAGVILMHKRGAPKDMQLDTRYGDLFDEVARGLEKAVERAVAAGIARESIVIDPGVGFGKSAEGNCELIARANDLMRRVGRPVLIGLSKKSFLAKITGGEASSGASNAAAHALALAHGASILRVHDVPAAVAAVRLSVAMRDAEREPR